MKPNLAFKEGPLALIRYSVALLMIAHAVARISLSIVDDFGQFLELQGFPFGTVVAWVITLSELLGSALLVLNRWVLGVSLYFIFQLTAGIVLVHLKEGWFVVGAGRNGMEYSVLLIICFIALLWSERKQKRAT